MTAAGDEPPITQRIDRWLWCARFFKSRTLAAKFVSEGRLRVTRNGQTIRADKPSFLINPSDTLVFSRSERLRIIEITSCAMRRGPANEAQSLYTDHTPIEPPKTERVNYDPFLREKGAGRPTKKDRRAIEALKDAD